EEAVKMSSVNQAREFNLENKGSLTPGKDSDILVLNEELTVEQTILGGNVHEFK
ncbi:MAG TPA: amidohydrolase family protein, partial [Atopostipes sp.]|nr:amidohydrolase family protein [Atopostipes sp.]